MKRIVLQLTGIVVIVVSVGGWWLLDRYGCAFNTAGCPSIFPRLTQDAILALAIPVGLGIALILFGRRMR